jgi:hypothetical protein
MRHGAARRGCVARVAWGIALTCVVLGGCSTARRPAPADTTHPSSPSGSHGRGLTPSRTSSVGGSDPGNVTRGTHSWRLTRPARERQIEGYATASSGPPGTSVALRVSTTASTYRVRAYRFGAYDGGDAHVVWVSRRQPGMHQGPAAFADRERRTIVAPWRTSMVVDTRAWVPGLYVFKLVASTGWQAHVPYVVSSPSSRGRTAVVFPVTTWQAYNDWGGYSLYEGPAGDRRSWAVSFDRPYPAPGAGEMLFGAVPVAVAAERLGIPLAWFTNIDLDQRPDALAGAVSYVSSGHDEYWTATMRQQVQSVRDSGTNLAFLGANTMYWRVRLESAGRVVVGYRSDAALDPAAPGRRTGLWRDSGPRKAENELTGMEYECFPVDAPFRVVSPHWWGFAGTATRAGEELPHLIGVEADRVYPVPSTPRPMQILAHFRYSCRGVGTSAQSTYYTTPSGAGVFSAGTLRWTCALSDRCPVTLSRRTVRFVNRVTGTVLREFARGPAGSRHPARDNVAGFDLPRRNQVPAS